MCILWLVVQSLGTLGEGVWTVDTVAPSMGLQTPSAPSVPFPSPSPGTHWSPMVGCKHPSLYLSGTGIESQETASPPPGAPGDWIINQRINMEGPMAQAAYVVEDGLVGHQWEERPLGLVVLDASVEES